MWCLWFVSVQALIETLPSLVPQVSAEAWQAELAWGPLEC